MKDHKISWREYDSVLDLFIEKSITVSKNVIEEHVKILKYRSWDNYGNQNIAAIKVEKIA